MDFTDPRYKDAIFNQFKYNNYKEDLAEIEFFDRKFSSFEDFMKADNIYEGLGIDTYINEDYEKYKDVYETAYGENTMAIHFPDDEDAQLFKLTKDPTTGKWNFGDIASAGREPELEDKFEELKNSYNRDVSTGYIGDPHQDKKLGDMNILSANPLLKSLEGEKKSVLSQITDSFFRLPDEHSAITSAYLEVRDDMGYEDGTDGYLYQMGFREFGDLVYNEEEFSTNDFTDEELDDNFIFENYVESGLMSESVRNEIREGWRNYIKYKYEIPDTPSVAPTGRIELEPEDTDQEQEDLIEEGRRILREEDVDFDDLDWMEEEGGMDFDVPQLPAFRFPYEDYGGRGFDLMEFLNNASYNGLEDELKMKQIIFNLNNNYKEKYTIENYEINSNGDLVNKENNEIVLSAEKYQNDLELREEANGDALGVLDEESRNRPIIMRSRMEAREDEEPVRDVFAEAEEDKPRRVRPGSDFPVRVENIRVGEDTDTIERGRRNPPPVSASGALVFGYRGAMMYDTLYQAQEDIIQLEERRRPRPIIRRRDRQPVEEQRRPRPIIRRRR